MSCRLTLGPRAFELATAVLLAASLGGWWAGRHPQPAALLQTASLPNTGPLAMDATRTTSQPLTESTLDQLRALGGVVLIDLWAPWCPPCRTMGPRIDELARDFAQRATVAKLDVDQYPDAAESLGVASIPTFVVLRDGVEEERLVGARSSAELAASLERALAR